MKLAAIIIAFLDAIAWIGGMSFAVFMIISLVSGGVHMDFSPK